MNTRTPHFIMVAIAGGLIGCQSGPSKEDEALKRAQNRKPPGFIRVINNTNTWVAAWDKGKAIDQRIEPGTYNTMTPIGEGNKPITIKNDKDSQDIPVTIVSGEGVTIYLNPDGSHYVLDGEIRRPSDSNVRIFVVDQKGSKVPNVKFSVKGLLGKKEVMDGDSLMLSEGDYELVGGPTEGSANVRVQDNLGYSFLFVKQPSGKFKPFMLQNTPSDKPRIGGGMQ